VDVEEKFAPISQEVYYIVPDKCTECMGFHEEPQCAAVCPVDCCVPDPEKVENEEILLERKSRLHL
jgi:ferredoxin